MENPIKDIVMETIKKYETFANDVRGLLQQIDSQDSTLSNRSITDVHNADNLAQNIQDFKDNKIAFKTCADNNRIIEAKTKMIGLQQKLYLNLASIPKRILQSSIDLLSSCYNDKKDTKEVERLRAQLNMMLEMLNVFDHKIQIETNELFDKYQKNLLHNSTMVECCYYSEYLGDKMDPKNAFVPYGLQSAIFNLTQGFTTLNYITILGMAIHQKIFESCFVSPKTNNLSEINDLISQLRNSFASDFSIVKRSLDSTSAKIESLHNKQNILDGKIDRKSEILVKKIENRNKRNKLTQEECACCLRDIKVKYNNKKREFLKSHDMFNEIKTIKDPVDCKRSIERWDTSDRPPEGYSRRLSELEFKFWAENYVNRKYENWKEKIRKQLLFLSQKK